jgi:hypothetical protein
MKYVYQVVEKTQRISMKIVMNKLSLLTILDHGSTSLIIAECASITLITAAECFSITLLSVAERVSVTLLRVAKYY